MKYGEQFERESAPQWSLHNIDYNSLKHHIKAHTTKGQATAVAIPGHHDGALRNFEDNLYEELCRQHDRVDLFVSSKADEIARRLQYLSSQMHRMLIRRAASRREGMSLKRQQSFAKHENDLLQCGDDIQSLQRFVGAQVVAFRKILKKYRKWTGSSTLGSRFRDAVLSHPKSFTRRDFSQLQAEHDNLLANLRTALPASDPVGSPSPEIMSSAPSIHASELVSPSETTAVPGMLRPQHTGYWNEYDHGSNAGDAEDNRDSGYAIYIHHGEDAGFPGMATLAAIFKSPMDRVNRWMSSGQRNEDEEQAGLLPPPAMVDGYGSVNSAYFTSHPGINSDTEAEDDGPAILYGRRPSFGYASSEEFPVGYKTYRAALPSVHEQHLARYRERVLAWGTWACFAASFLLMGIAAVLMQTGRHKMRLEVDAGVTLGIMASLGTACAGLGMTFSRQDHIGWVSVVVVWILFMTACVLNGVLLVMVVGNSPL